MGSPEMVPIPAASGDGLLTPTADGSVAPDTVPRAAHPGGEQQVMCVCVCVCVCVWGCGRPSARGIPQLNSKQPSSGWG